MVRCTYISLKMLPGESLRVQVARGKDDVRAFWNLLEAKKVAIYLACRWFFQEGDVTGSVEDDKRGGGFDNVEDGKGEGDEGDEGESEGSSDDVSILGCTPPVFVLSLFNAP